ncbi:MAG: hypothetical protein WCX65_17315 [bacterium]
MSDGTMYVTCNGLPDTNEKTKDQFLLRLAVDNNGLASNNTSVVTHGTKKLCPQPTELAKDPDENYVFAICYYDNLLVVLDAATGEILQDKIIPGHPIHVVASRDYVFVSTSTGNKIMRYPINPLQ